MSIRTFPLSGPITLAAKVGAGSISVIAEEGLTHATVDVVPRQPGSNVDERALVELRGSRLVVETPKPKNALVEFVAFGGRSNDAADITVTIPADAAVNITSYFADVTIQGRVGKTDVSGGASTITVDQVAGDARLKYGAGTAHLGRVTGSALVKCGSGPVTVGEVGGHLVVAKGSGDLTVDLARDRVHSRGGSGDVTILAAHGDVDMVSGSGTVTVGVPIGVSARLDVTTGAGELRSDLPVEDAPRNKAKQITVRVRTGSGDVRVVRATEG